MPIYDLVCSEGHEHYDLFLRVGEKPPCSVCGNTTDTLWKRSSNVIADEIPGGLEIRHGLCDPETGAPVRYYSKSDIAKEAKKRGLHNLVEHKPDPKSGSDKSKHTTRWV